MGNCQAAEAATVVIQHPGNKVERIYWSVSAQEVMTTNPGHYVALVVISPTAKSENGLPVKQLKLLRPIDTLLMGQVYRLISFEDVLKEFAAKKSVKLGKLLDRGGLGEERKKLSGSSNSNQDPNPQSYPSVQMDHRQVLRQGGSRSVGRHHLMGGGGAGGGQWRPALQSISETGN